MTFEALNHPKVCSMGISGLVQSTGEGLSAAAGDTAGTASHHIQATA